MPARLESEMLLLSSEEQIVYREAAAHLRATADMALDLNAPLSVTQWIFLQVAHAVVRGDAELVEFLIAKIDAVQKARRQPQ